MMLACHYMPQGYGMIGGGSACDRFLGVFTTN